MMGENFSIRSCILPQSTSSSITKSVPEPITVLVVHTETNKIAHLCMNGPMDTNSVKNGAMVTDMRQKLNSTDFWHGSRLA